jgi:hypothetical protein
VAWVRLNDAETLLESRLVELDGPVHLHDVERIERSDDAVIIHARGGLTLAFEDQWDARFAEALTSWADEQPTGFTIEGGARYAQV